MNHLRSHPDKSDREDKMTKKCLKDLKVATYKTKENLPLLFNHRTTLLSMLYSEQLYVGRSFRNFPRMHVNEDKACWKDKIGLSRWFSCLEARSNITIPLF